jgi:hypothetical protein
LAQIEKQATTLLGCSPPPDGSMTHVSSSFGGMAHRASFAHGIARSIASMIVGAAPEPT